MKIILLRTVLLSFGFAMIFAEMAIAEEVNHCVRVYCEKNEKKKLQNSFQHGRFFPAFFDKKSNIYFISEADFNEVIGEWECDLPPGTKSLPGTDAAVKEFWAPWVEVRTKENAIYSNDKCEEMERK